MFQQGIQLLERFAQDDRIRIRQPRRNQQVKLSRKISDTNDFVAYVDALDSSTGSVVYWNGRPLLVGIRNNPTDCSPSILSSSATPG